MTTPQIEALREAIARIVDASAFAERPAPDTAKNEGNYRRRKTYALTKASQIAALITSGHEASQRRIGELEEALNHVATRTGEYAGLCRSIAKDKPDRRFDLISTAEVCEHWSICLRAALNTGDAG